MNPAVNLDASRNAPGFAKFDIVSGVFSYTAGVDAGSVLFERRLNPNFCDRNFYWFLTIGGNTDMLVLDHEFSLNGKLVSTLRTQDRGSTRSSFVYRLAPVAPSSGQTSESSMLLTPLNATTPFGTSAFNLWIRADSYRVRAILFSKTLVAATTINFAILSRQPK